MPPLSLSLSLSTFWVFRYGNDNYRYRWRYRSYFGLVVPKPFLFRYPTLLTINSPNTWCFAEKSSYEEKSCQKYEHLTNTCIPGTYFYPIQTRTLHPPALPETAPKTRQSPSTGARACSWTSAVIIIYPSLLIIKRRHTPLLLIESCLQTERSFGVRLRGNCYQ